MSNKTIVLATVLSFLCFSEKSLAQVSEKQHEISEEEIIALIPRSMDGPPDAKEIEGYQKLLSLGSRTYPVLCEKLNQTDDPFLASNIISVLVKSEGDKTLPRQALSKLVQKWNSQSESGKALLQQSARALGDIGTKEDVPVLLSLLSNPASTVRVNTLRSLVKIGDEQTAEQVHAWVTTRKASLSEAQQLRDPSIREAEKTMTVMKDRLKKKER